MLRSFPALFKKLLESYLCLTSGVNLHLIGRSTENGKISGHGRSSATAAVILRASDSSEAAAASFLSRLLLRLVMRVLRRELADLRFLFTVSRSVLLLVLLKMTRFR